MTATVARPSLPLLDSDSAIRIDATSPPVLIPGGGQLAIREPGPLLGLRVFALRASALFGGGGLLLLGVGLTRSRTLL